MNDLISRQALLKELPYANWGKEWDEALAKAIIEGMPSIDPVKRGKWEYRNIGGWHCSVCDEQAPFWCMASTQNLSNYCPNCGAKMDMNGGKK